MTRKTHLRLWPGVVIALLVASYVIPMFLPEAFLFGLIGGLVGALALLVWWVFFSRTPWSERVGAVILMAVALAVSGARYPGELLAFRLPESRENP